MKIKICLAAILLFLCSAQIGSAQVKTLSGGIINGRATKLPPPDYPQEAKDLCASGQVKVQVLVDEDGSVISAEAVSGDEFLRASAVEAAKNAEFSPTPEFRIKVKGFVVYNFVPEKKCIDAGIVNKKALRIPKPQIENIIQPKHLRILEEQTVQVRIIIEISSGKVLRAKAISGHPMLRSACEESARQTIFHVTNDIPNIPVKAVLVYKFKLDGTIEF